MTQQTSAQLEIGRLVPPFRLESTAGEMVSPWDFKGRKALLVLLFVPTDSDHVAALAAVARRYREIAKAGAEVLAVASCPLRMLRECAGELRVPFPLLADETGAVHADYGVSGLSLLAADRFGELRLMREACEDFDEALDDAITAIELSELECPECGVTTWPVD